jgi:tetratricopeptide (TPR) repeat protein
MEFMDASFLDALPGLLFLAAGLAALLWARRFAFAAALFLIPLLPVLNLVPIGEVLAERFLYLPVAGVGLAFGLLIQRLAKGRALHVVLGLGAVLLLLFGVLTVKQVEVWTDHFALWSHGVAADPEDPQARMGLGLALLKKGVLHGESNALSELKKTRELNPNYKPDIILYNIARTYEQMGKLEEAFQHYEESLQHNPFSSLALEAVLNLNQNAPNGPGSFLTPDQKMNRIERLLRLTREKEKRDELLERFKDRS